MKTKKILAASLAAAMMVSTLPAATASAEEIEGGVIFVKQDIYDVTLPTTASQKFYLDPEGLIAVGKGGSVADAGKVVGIADMYAVNRSSIPVALSASYKLADTAESDGVTIVDTVADEAAGKAIQDDVTKKVAVSITAAEAATDADGKDCGGHVVKDTGSAQDISSLSAMTADVVYAKDSTGAAAEAAYIMTKEDYKFQLKDGKTADDAYDSSAYEYVIDTTAKKASCLKLSIGGYCSTKADWTDYTNGTNELKLDITFKFKKVVPTTAADYTNVKAGTDEVKVGPQVTMTAGGLITISGLTADKNFKGFADIKVGDATESYAIQATNATFSDALGWTAADGGTCTFQLKGGWTGWDGRTATVTVTLIDGSTITSSPVTLAF